jgi:hypothetical protein
MSRRIISVQDMAVSVELGPPGPISYKKADSGGLYLLVNQSGRYWRYDYRHAGKRKTMALGVYPEVSLAEAPSTASSRSWWSRAEWWRGPAWPPSPRGGGAEGAN